MKIGIINRILIDTSFWKAMFDKSDHFHYEADLFLHWMVEQEKFEIVITNLILAEVGNWFKKGVLKRFSKKVIKFIVNLNNLGIIYDEEEYRETILKLYYQFGDKLGYVDCFNAIVCIDPENKIKYMISHDSEYDSIAEITRLTTIPV
jgi:predicted nucleic acid-binding protein